MVIETPIYLRGNGEIIFYSDQTKKHPFQIFVVKNEKTTIRYAILNKPFSPSDTISIKLRNFVVISLVPLISSKIEIESDCFISWYPIEAVEVHIQAKKYLLKNQKIPGEKNERVYNISHKHLEEVTALFQKVIEDWDLQIAADNSYRALHKLDELITQGGSSLNPKAKEFVPAHSSKLGVQIVLPPVGGSTDLRVRSTPHSALLQLPE